MRDTIIRLNNLTRRFGDVTAVSGLSLEIGRGEIFGLVGPDGAGKTTVQRILAGLLDPSDGSASVAGHDVVNDVTSVKEHIGYMAQRFGLYGDLSVEENMVFYADLFGIVGEDRERLMSKLLDMTRMEPFRDRPAAKLSGGMQQKLALMSTLLHRPEVLLLDEPTNGVDPLSRRDFWAILYSLVGGGMTVVVSTAYLDEAERCNRVGLLHKGRLIRCDTPDALRSGMEDTCYEVTCPEVREMRTVLEGHPAVTSLAPSGESLHVFVDPERASLAELQSSIEGKCRQEAKWQEIVPSLEDVFIATIQKESKTEGALQ